MFLTGLLAFGDRLSDQGRTALAAEVYGAMLTPHPPFPSHSAGQSGPPLPQGERGISLGRGSRVPSPLEGEGATTSDLRTRAQQRLDALMGRGHSGRRAEVLLGSFAKTATDYRIIVPMLAGSMVYQAARTATLSRLVTGTEAGWWTRGLGARLSSSMVGFALEVPTFALSARGLMKLSGEPVEEAPLGQDLLGTTLTLGALKLFGYAGAKLANSPSPPLILRGGKKTATPPLKLRGGRGELPFPAPNSTRGSGLISTTSTFVGLLTAHRLQVGLGLQPQADGATTITDTLGFMVSLGVGGHLGHRLLGARWARLQGELALRSDLLKNSGPIPKGNWHSLFSPQGPLALAISGKRPPSSALKQLPPGVPRGLPIAMMSKKGEGTSLPAPSRGNKDKPVPIKIPFSITDCPTEVEILEIVRAIVAQDKEFYPGGDASGMSAGPRYFQKRWYRIGDRELPLQTLAGWVRRARGLKTGDINQLSNPRIIQGWKEALGVEETGRGGLEIRLDFNLSPEPSEGEILKIVRAIVAQDKEFYPGGDASGMSAGKKYFRDHWYRIGDRELTLHTLAGWLRRARGLKTQDSKQLPQSRIVQGWKEALGVEETGRGGLEIRLDFNLSPEPSEAEILEIVRAIVAQDKELYPGGDASGISTGKKYFRDHRYRIGDRELTLLTLAGWVRRARGLKVQDSKQLPESRIVQGWKEALGIEIKELQRDILEIRLDFELSPEPSETEILKIVRAIVAQDKVLYPGGDASGMSTGARYFKDRWYRIGDRKLPLQTLAYWVRRARGLRTDDYKQLPESRIVQGWKEALGVVDFSKSSVEELEAFIKQAHLHPILELFSDDPAELIEVLAFLKKNEFKHKDVTEFVKAYVGLKVEGIASGTIQPKPEIDPWEKRRFYLRAILQALEAAEDLDLSEKNFQNQLSLLIRLSRKAFEEASERLIQELGSQAQSASHPFLQRLQGEAAEYFQKTLAFEIRGMRTSPYGYQKEGAHFLTTHGRAILADEAGMGKSYQVLAAVESLGRVLWVTTAANKETLREEILGHSFTPIDKVKIVISGNPGERKAQIRSLNGEKYLITNYETLVALQKNDPEGYARLTQGLDLVVVDEAQLTDNPQTLRTQAIHDIVAPRRWLLTATPYQNRPENMWALLNWLNPEKYPNFNAFKQMYTQSTEGLVLLHSELIDLMLRRTKKDTLSYFQSPEKITFADQLKDGIPRLPKKIRLSPELSGKYELSPAQADLIAWMIADNRGWAEHFNQNLPEGAEKIALEKINPLQKFGMIHKVIYEPAYFGLSEPGPLFEALDTKVGQRLAQGKKLILWAWNTSMIEALERRYNKLGVRRIDGNVLGEARERARHDFQEDPRVRILVANYLSGGVGLTLTAAHSAIFVQLPDRYPLLYQAEGRHQRLIGPNNVRHAKQQVDVEWMIPVYPKSFLKDIQDKRLSEILSHGTLVEQTRSRLEGGEILFNLLMEGYGKVEDLEKYFKAEIIQAMGLNREEKLNYVSHLKGEVRDYAEVVQNLFPLWALVKGHPEAEEKVLRLMELFKNYPKVAEQVGQAFREGGKAYADDLDFLASLFHLRNKYIRAQVLERVPDLLVKVYAQGKSLAQAVEGLKIGSLSPSAFLALAYVQSGTNGEVIQGLSRELAGMRDTPLKRYLEEHFHMGVLGILGNDVAEGILAEKGDLLMEERQAVPNKIHALYRLGLLSRTRGDLLESLRQQSFDTFEGLSHALEGATYRAIAEFAERSPEQVAAMVQTNPHWHGNADPLLALMAGYRELGGDQAEVLLGQFREVLGHLLDGDYEAWRLGENSRYQGKTIDYLKSPAFWERFNQADITELSHVRVEAKQVQASLLKDYLALLEEYEQEGGVVEGAWVKGELQAYRAADPRQKGDSLRRYREEIRLLGPLLGGQAVTEEAKGVLEKYGLKGDGGPGEKVAIQQKLTEIRNLVGWMVIEEGFREWVDPSPQPSPRRGEGELVRELEAKVKFFRSRKYDKMAEHFEALKEGLLRHQAGSLTFREITIEDTADPAILTRMGALHPELTNCFNPNGNPIFNQFIVSALGSKNMRMMVVRERGKIVATAMAKVKQLEDGTPVLFLERGLYRKAYDFRQEMLMHLARKAELLSAGLTPHLPSHAVAQSVPLPVGERGLDYDVPRRVPSPRRGEGQGEGSKDVLVMDEVRGKPKETDPYVLGIGAYAEHEYVEPVFGLRRAANVRHRGRIFVMPKDVSHSKPSLITQTGDPSPRPSPRGGEGVNDSPPIPISELVSILGIGTSNKKWEDYVSQLKRQEVRVLIDVRANPQSRFFPHFNRKRMESELAKEGIQYLWMGDTLGNPKDAQGQRTLAGFQNYMSTLGYQQGMSRLREILLNAPGNVALTCAEGKECDCHRRYVLEDLKK